MSRPAGPSPVDLWQQAGGGTPAFSLAEYQRLLQEHDLSVRPGDRIRFVTGGEVCDLVVTEPPVVGDDGTMTFMAADAEAHAQAERLAGMLARHGFALGGIVHPGADSDEPPSWLPGCTYGSAPTEPGPDRSAGITCGRCGQPTGNNSQGHYWSICKAKGGSLAERKTTAHFCCPPPAGCELQPPEHRVARQRTDDETAALEPYDNGGNMPSGPGSCRNDTGEPIKVFKIAGGRLPDGTVAAEQPEETGRG